MQKRTAPSLDSLILTPAELAALEQARKSAQTRDEAVARANAQLAVIDALLAAFGGGK